MENSIHRRSNAIWLVKLGASPFGIPLGHLIPNAPKLSKLTMKYRYTAGVGVIACTEATGRHHPILTELSVVN